jgi:hypothetical protein
MNKRLCLLAVAVLLFSAAESQSFEWVNTVPVDYEYNPSMIQYTTCADPQGGVYFFGIQEHVMFYNQSMGSLFLKKYNEAGELQWSRTMTGESMAAGIASNGNDVFLYGQMYADMDFWGEDSLIKTGIGTDAYLTRVSNDGDLVWCLNLSSLQLGEGTISNLVITPQGQLLVAYSTWTNSYALLFSIEGELVQSIVQQNVNVISGIDIDTDGNIFTAGSCAGWSAVFNGVSYPAPFSYTTYLVKYNADLQPVWVKYIEDFTCTFPLVRVDNQGWIYFAGPLISETQFDTITVNGTAWSYDFFLARLNPDGDYQWVKECPEVMTGDATVGSLHFLDVDEEGNALLAGSARGTIDWGGGHVSEVEGFGQTMILWSYSESGNVNWVKTGGGSGYEEPGDLSSGPGGRVYICGVFSGQAEFDTITLSSTGLIDPFLAKLNAEFISGTEEVRKPSQEILVYPNPARDRVLIQTEMEFSKYSIFNQTGQLVQAGTFDPNIGIINISGLSPGVFTLNLMNTKTSKSFFLPVIVGK